MICFAYLNSVFWESRGKGCRTHVCTPLGLGWVVPHAGPCTVLPQLRQCYLVHSCAVPFLSHFPTGVVCWPAGGITSAVLWSECAPPQIRMLNPNCQRSWYQEVCESLERWLGHEGGALVDGISPVAGISAFTKETLPPRSSLPPSAVPGTMRSLPPRKGSSPALEPWP